MADLALDVFLGLACAGALASMAYAVIAALSVNAFGREQPVNGAEPSVTILKPLYGVDAGLEDNLRSFFLQDYPSYQIVLCIQSQTDPAIEIARRVCADFPSVDSTIVIAPAEGPNYKIGNLANGYAKARHGFLVIADSDMRVTPAYLGRVMAPFSDAGVGAVTCLYKGRPAGGLPSRLASLFISGWFLPSVLVRARLAPIRFCLGATMAVRRDVFDRIGGFPALIAELADDHRLGALVTLAGYRVALSDYVVENVVYEEDFADLFRHELRWARTVRAVEPLGHAFSFLMFPVPLALAAGFAVQALLGWTWAALGLIALALVLRAWMQATVRAKLNLPDADRALWLLAARDVLSLIVWGASYCGRTVAWRNRGFTVTSNGRLVPRSGAGSRMKVRS